MSRYNLRERRQIDYNELNDCDFLNTSREEERQRNQLSKELNSFKNEIHFKILKQLKHKKSIKKNNWSERSNNNSPLSLKK